MYRNIGLLLSLVSLTLFVSPFAADVGSDDDVPSTGGGASMPTTESSLARLLVSKLVIYNLIKTITHI